MLKQKAHRILNQLQNNGTPCDGLSYYTVGDSFRTHLLQIEDEIVSLTNQPGIVTKVVKGGFGSGKSHFLDYLDWMLNNGQHDDLVISRVSLDKLHNPDDFQLLILKGMRAISEDSSKDNSYIHLLIKAYHASKDFYIEKRLKNSYLDVKETKELYALIIYQLLAIASQNALSPEIIQLLDKPQRIKKMVQPLTNRRISHLLEKAKEQADDENVRFVDAYLNLIDDSDKFAGSFDMAARKLSEEGMLTDIVFKVLKISGVKTIVILLDEMESLKNKKTNLGKALTNIRVFIDGLKALDNDFGYPSIAFVCASTEEFFSDSLRKNEPSLHSRLDDSGREIVLEIFSPADIDNLVFKLRELFFFAGKKLPKLLISDSGEHDAISMRQRIIQKFRDNPSELTCRKLVREILRELDGVV